MKFYKLAQKGLIAGLFALVSMSSQAGLIVAIDMGDDGIDFIVADEGVGDNASGAPGIVNIFKNFVGFGSFSITAESGAPDNWELTDVQLNSNIAANTTWKVYISDDSYTGTGTHSFITEITPTTIGGDITLGILSSVDGTTVLSNADLVEDVLSTGLATVSLVNNPFTVTHEYTITAGATGGQVSFDTKTAAPEPGTLVLFSLALMGLALIRRKYYAAQ